MELTRDARCCKVSKYEIEITLPKREKKYILLQNDLTKCP